MAPRADRFGHPVDPAVGYARGAILASETEEVLRQRQGYELIRRRFRRYGDAGVYNLTGLIRGFPFQEGDEEWLRSYLHFNVRCDGQLEVEALKMLGGDAEAHDGFLATRVSAGILAAILALVKPEDRVLSLVPADRSHPSICQAVGLARGRFHEVTTLEHFATALTHGSPPALVVISPIAPSKHHMAAGDVVRAIARAREVGTRVMLDDAHMAVRIAFYDEAPALALGQPDVVVWSLDKHLGGPRSGFVAGRKDLIRTIRARAFALGLEAQPAQYLAGLCALKAFDPHPIREAGELARRLLARLRDETEGRVYLAGPGVALSGEDLLEIALARAEKPRTALVPVEAVSVASLTMVEPYGVVTIPVTGMPGAASVFRLMMYPDGKRLGADTLLEATRHAIANLVALLDEPSRARALVLGTGS